MTNAIAHLQKAPITASSVTVLTRFAWSKPLKKCCAGVTLAIYHDFHGLKLSYHFFITKTKK